SAATGWGFPHSARPLAGAKAAHRPRSTVSAPAPAASSPYETFLRPSACHRVAGSRSPDPPRTSARSGSAPGKSSWGPYGARARWSSKVRGKALRSGATVVAGHREVKHALRSLTCTDLSTYISDTMRESAMSVMTYTDARANFKDVMDRAINDHEEVV